MVSDEIQVRVLVNLPGFLGAERDGSLTSAENAGDWRRGARALSRVDFAQVCAQTARQEGWKDGVQEGVL